MLLLFETSSGFALFKVDDEEKLKKADASGAEIGAGAVKVAGWMNFETTAVAMEACSALVESKLSEGLKEFLQENVVAKGVKDQLAVADSKVGSLIKESLGIQCTSGAQVTELMRCVRARLPELLASAVPTEAMGASSLGLAHSFSRYKLKFSPEKVDTMIVQAVSLLDDLDKEINTYSMRVREWYGWHFPEMGKVVQDNLTYAKVVLTLGARSSALKLSLSDVLPEDLEREVKELSQVSMGTEVSDEDMENIRALCQQVVDITNFREQLWDYLRNRMQAIAPNLSTLVGELVGARLIAHTGSLIGLAKYPASTIQILGAEKALFRALKTKKKTPKYGLIYHASLIGQAPTKGKGQISRVLAAKAALCARVDALAEVAASEATVGVDGRSKVESRIRRLENQGLRGAAGAPRRSTGVPKKYESDAQMTDVKSYDTSRDVTMKAAPAKKPAAAPVQQEEPKKRKHPEETSEKAPAAEAAPAAPEVAEEGKKKKKTKKAKAPEEAAAAPVEAAPAPAAEPEAAAPKKKKAKKAAPADQ